MDANGRKRKEKITWIQCRSWGWKEEHLTTRAPNYFPFSWHRRREKFEMRTLFLAPVPPHSWSRWWCCIEWEKTLGFLPSFSGSCPLKPCSFPLWSYQLLGEGESKIEQVKWDSKTLEIQSDIKFMETGFWSKNCIKEMWPKILEKIQKIKRKITKNHSVNEGF